MKIRTNYVSNSSSSSFCIWGICLNDYIEDYDERREFLDNLYEKLRLASRYGGGMGTKISKYNGLGDYSENDDFIGLSPNWQKDDETLLQFKEKIAKELNSFGLKNITAGDIELYCDGGYDG